jgi:N-acetylmuramoyl-L-alanine amidase
MTLIGAGIALGVALIAVLVGLAIGAMSSNGGDRVVTPTPSVVATEPPDGADEPTPTPIPEDPPRAAHEPTVSTEFVVCIDPGHQAKANLDGEPIGPGASETKPKVTGGATGTVTGQPEHELVLAVSLLLADRLESAGVKVVMTRTEANVDISNSERASVANEAKADLFVRVHADGSTEAKVHGISTLYPAGNEWVKPIASESKAAAAAIHRALLGVTKAPDRGVIERSDLSGFNWCTVPTVLLECGFLSNAEEDRLLATSAYRAKLVDGIAQGVLAYLEKR